MSTTLHRLRKTSDLRRLAEPLAERHGLPPETVKVLLQDVFTDLRALAHENGRVHVHGFGVFRMQRTAPKMGRNPRTGEQVPIPERLQLRFAEARGRGDSEPRTTQDTCLPSEDQASPAD